MAAQWPDLEIYDGDFDTPQAVGLPVFSSPVRATTAEYQFTQSWMVSRKAFRPTPLNTPHPSGGQSPDYSSYVLVAEGPRNDVGGGVVKWDRTYAQVPASHDEFETFSYPFIGFVGQTLSGTTASAVVTVLGRPREAVITVSRVQHDYFLITPPRTPAEITIYRSLQYQASLPAGAVVTSGTPQSDFITDSLPPGAGTPVWSASKPSRTEYVAWMENAKTLGWDGGVLLDRDPATWAAVTNPSQFVAEDSRLTRWQGSIYLRQTRFVLAQ